MLKIKFTNEQLELAGKVGALKMGTFKIISQDRKSVVIEIEKSVAEEARKKCLDAVLEIGLDGKDGNSHVSPLGEEIEGVADVIYAAIKC